MERRPDRDDEERTIDAVETAAAPTDTDPAVGAHHAPSADVARRDDVDPLHDEGLGDGGLGDGGLDDGADTDEEGPRRRRGALSSIIVAGMLGLEEALGKKPKQEAPIVIASNSDPEDIDEHGIVIDLDSERTVVSPPLPGRVAAPQRKRVKRRRDA